MHEKIRLKDIRVNVPEGSSGDWHIEKFSVSKEDSKFDQLRSIFNGSSRYVSEGTYTRIRRGIKTIMSDTPDEIKDHYSPINSAKGEVLIAGLGLGVVIQGIYLRNTLDRIKKITVIEKSKDVINLVGDHYKKKLGDKIEIINDDIYDWKIPKDQKFDYCWFDIWDNICTDNLEGIKKLKYKFRYRCQSNEFWVEGLLNSIKKRNNSNKKWMY